MVYLGLEGALHFFLQLLELLLMLYLLFLESLLLVEQ